MLAATLALAFLPLATTAPEELHVPAGFPTIQAAVDAAHSDDTIVVHKGTYFEHVSVIGKSDLAILAKGKVIVNGAATGIGFEVQSSPGTRLVGFTIEYCSIGIYVGTSANVTVQKCIVRNHNSGLVTSNCQGAMLDSNTIANTGLGISLWGSGSGTTGSIVRKNKMSDTGNVGIQVLGSMNLLEHNTIKNSSDAGIAFVPYPECHDNEVRWNKVYDSVGNGISVAGSKQFVHHNLVKHSGDNGIIVFDSDHRIDTNTVIATIGDGIELAESAYHNTLSSNVVVKASDDGYDVRGGDNALQGNRASGCGDNGFSVPGKVNTFIANKSAGAGSFDLEDFNAPGINVYIENKFKKANFAP